MMLFCKEISPQEKSRWWGAYASSRGVYQSVAERMRKAVFLICAMSICASAQSAENGITDTSFSLIKGEEFPVCVAYTKQLNATKFEVDPYCNRSIVSSNPPLRIPRQVRLSGEEILQVYAPVEGFVNFRDPAFYDKLHEKYPRESDGRRGIDVDAERAARWRDDSDLCFDKEAEANPYIRANRPNIFRFVPAVDIDNDGITDNVIGRRQPPACGTTSGADPNPKRGPTFLVFLDEKGMPDVERTRAVFGHPKGKTMEFRDHKTGKIRVIESPLGFRSIGYGFGVFRYASEYYFDTFYPFSDLENKRYEDPTLPDTLAVFRRKEGQNSLMCEIRWNRPEAMQ